jgi:hypothetical protein
MPREDHRSALQAGRGISPLQQAARLHTAFVFLGAAALARLVLPLLALALVEASSCAAASDVSDVVLDETLRFRAGMLRVGLAVRMDRVRSGRDRRRRIGKTAAGIERVKGKSREPEGVNSSAGASSPGIRASYDAYVLRHLHMRAHRLHQVQSRTGWEIHKRCHVRQDAVNHMARPRSLGGREPATRMLQPAAGALADRQSTGAWRNNARAQRSSWPSPQLSSRISR